MPTTPYGSASGLQGEVLEQQLAYWKEQLADLSTLELPTDRPRPPVPSNQGAHFAFDLPAPLTQALKELSRREGATLFMTLLAAFQVLLHRYSGQDDIAVGTPIAGRRRTELEGLIGFFVNTLVLRTDLAGNPTFSELLARVRDSALGAYTHQDLPFEKLVEELSPSRDMSRNPLFQVMFVLQNAPDAAPALQGVQASRLPLAGHSAKFDLTLIAARDGSTACTRAGSTAPICSTPRPSSAWRSTLGHCWRASSPMRISASVSCRCSPHPNAISCWSNGTTRRPTTRRIAASISCSRSRSHARPMRSRVVFEDERLSYARA